MKEEERIHCPRCHAGNGVVTDAAGSRISCPACRGKGTWEAYRLHREFVKGWNAALHRVADIHMDSLKPLP